jgi:hypothetical protein
MGKGRTKEGYPCKYAPYYRGHYKSKYIPDTLEEEQRLTRHMEKTFQRIIKNLKLLEELALPNEEYGKHYFHDVRMRFIERFKVATVHEAKALDECLENTIEALKTYTEKSRKRLSEL